MTLLLPYINLAAIGLNLAALIFVYQLLKKTQAKLDLLVRVIGNQPPPP